MREEGICTKSYGPHYLLRVSEASHSEQIKGTWHLNVHWSKTPCLPRAGCQRYHTWPFYFFGKGHVGKLFHLCLLKLVSYLQVALLSGWPWINNGFLLKEQGQKSGDACASHCVLCTDLISIASMLCSGLSPAPQP